jgi:hypothetical protein
MEVDPRDTARSWLLVLASFMCGLTTVMEAGFDRPAMSCWAVLLILGLGSLAWDLGPKDDPDGRESF